MIYFCAFFIIILQYYNSTLYSFGANLANKVYPP